jgi:hypothetical protein
MEQRLNESSEANINSAISNSRNLGLSSAFCVCPWPEITHRPKGDWPNQVKRRKSKFVSISLSKTGLADVPACSCTPRSSSTLEHTTQTRWILVWKLFCGPSELLKPSMDNPMHHPHPTLLKKGIEVPFSKLRTLSKCTAMIMVNVYSIYVLLRASNNYHVANSSNNTNFAIRRQSVLSTRLFKNRPDNNRFPGISMNTIIFYTRTLPLSRHEDVFL